MRKKIGQTKQLSKPLNRANINKRPEHLYQPQNQQNQHNQVRQTQYQRFINNKVLNNCRRPQRKDWCGPITIAEIIQILLDKEYSIDQIAKMNKWSPDAIVGGKLGTASIIHGVQTSSLHRIQAKILNIKNDLSSWSILKKYLQSSKHVIYYHEPGHHLLLCGFIEEPLIDRDDIWNHQNIHKTEYNTTRRWLVKAEHNVKRADYVDQGILVPVEFPKVCQNLAEKKNCALVLFSI